MSNIIAIAQNTFKETIRDRILYTITFLGILYITLTFFLATISLDQGPRVIMDFGLVGILIFGLFIGIFVGANLLHKELSLGAAFLIFPKPLSRSQYILGKFLGLAFTILVVLVVLTLIFIAGYWIQNKSFFSGPTYWAIFASYLEILIIIAIAILFGSFASPINSSLYTFALFIAGHSYSTIVHSAFRNGNNFFLYTSKALYYLLPNLEKFNLRSFAVHNIHIDTPAIILMSVYAIIYISLLLFIAIAALKKREF